MTELNFKMNNKTTRSNDEDVAGSMIYGKYSASSNNLSYLNNNDSSAAEQESSDILNNDFNTSPALNHSVDQLNEGNGSLNALLEDEEENLINSQNDLVNIPIVANSNYDSLDDDYEPEEEPYDDEDYTFNYKNDSRGRKRKLAKKIPKQKQSSRTNKVNQSNLFSSNSIRNIFYFRNQQSKKLKFLSKKFQKPGIC